MIFILLYFLLQTAPNFYCKYFFRASAENSPAENSLRSSMKFDENYEQDIETISKTDTELHVRVNQYSVDEADYPRNPFGDRPETNRSLFFNDGLRSVDFVLVWKKLLPSEVNDGDETDGSREKEMEEILKKEEIRTEKREVFEENLLQEGLELERYVIDEEIHFVKIHAPLEVLRRYAEILKLRLPMKEVSKLFNMCMRINL